MFKPELPPNDTAVIRAFVGSDGSTGAVNGAISAMLAKLGAESGTSSMSFVVMTVCTVLDVVSSGWLANDGPRSLTSTDCRTTSGCRITRTVGSEPTATVILSALAAKPVA